MFEEKKLFDLFKSLAPEQQNEAIDFMEFIKQRKGSIEKKTQEEIKNEKPFRQFGGMKGLVVYMAEDFDEPLEDFAEYM